MKARETLVFVVLLFAVYVLVRAVTGCGVWGARAANAADAVAYGRELDSCLAEARDAGRSLAVYEQCAREADARHGLKDGGAQ